MKNFIVEMWGSDRVVITPERAEMITKVLAAADRPEFIDFVDVMGRKYFVKTEQILKIKDGRTDLDFAYENARKGKSWREI